MPLLDLFLLLGPLVSSAHAYSLVKSYDATNFLDADSFNWYDGWDVYNKGLVTYLPREKAMQASIAKITPDKKVYLGVDSSARLTSATPGPGNGRKSFRLESLQTIDQGLLIADIDHLPSSACGTWTAFWLAHDSGDGYNEIDIVENISLEQNNWSNAYTTFGSCPMNDLGGTGTNRGMNCQIGSGGCHNYNPPGTFGDSFNSHKGGVWATQIEAEGIKVWHFARGTEPADINSPSPDPTKWPKPVMNLGAANCNMKNVFRGMKIIINITMCGTFASPNWAGNPTCRQRGPTCERYVADNPAIFKDAYFLFNYVKYYKKQAPGQVASSSSAAGLVNKVVAQTASSAKSSSSTAASSSIVPVSLSLMTLVSTPRSASPSSSAVAVSTPGSATSSSSTATVSTPRLLSSSSTAIASSVPGPLLSPPLSLVVPPTNTLSSIVTPNVISSTSTSSVTSSPPPTGGVVVLPPKINLVSLTSADALASQSLSSASTASTMSSSSLKSISISTPNLVSSTLTSAVSGSSSVSEVLSTPPKIALISLKSTDESASPSLSSSSLKPNSISTPVLASSSSTYPVVGASSASEALSVPLKIALLSISSVDMSSSQPPSYTSVTTVINSIPSSANQSISEKVAISMPTITSSASAAVVVGSGSTISARSSTPTPEAEIGSSSAAKSTPASENVYVASTVETVRATSATEARPEAVSSTPIVVVSSTAENDRYECTTMPEVIPVLKLAASSTIATTTQEAAGPSSTDDTPATKIEINDPATLGAMPEITPGPVPEVVPQPMLNPNPKSMLNPNPKSMLDPNSESVPEPYPESSSNMRRPRRSRTMSTSYSPTPTPSPESAPEEVSRGGCQSTTD